MGQDQCRCLRGIQHEAAEEEQLTRIELNNKIRAARFRINTISNNNSSRPQTADMLVDRPQQPKKQPHRKLVTLLLRGSHHDFVLSLQMTEPEKIFAIGSTADIPVDCRIKPQQSDDMFRLSVKFVNGEFFVKDDAVGLGCFYRLARTEMLQLKNSMIIGIGQEFITVTRQDESLSQSKVSQTSVKTAQVGLNVHGGCIPPNTYRSIYMRDASRFRIGKSQICELPLMDSLLSPIHCTAFGERCSDNINEQNAYDWFLMDGSDEEASHTGTWVYLSHTTKLLDGLQMRCGSTHFTCQLIRQ